MKHRIPIIALSLLMTSCLRAEPTTQPATKPGKRLSKDQLEFHVWKEGMTWEKTIADPHRWALQQWHDGPIEKKRLDKLVKTGVVEKKADLDHDGKPELFLRPNVPARVWSYLVFKQVQGGYRYMGGFGSGGFRIMSLGPNKRPRVRTSWSMGANEILLQTLEHNGKKFVLIENVTFKTDPSPASARRLKGIYESDSPLPNTQPATQPTTAEREKIAALIRKLESPDIQTCKKAIRALGSLGPVAAPAAAPLIKLLKKAVDSVDQTDLIDPIMDALAKIGKKAVPALIEAAKSENFDMHKFALITLARMGPEAKEAVPVLIEILKGNQPNRIYAQVAYVLGTIGPDAKSAIPALQEASKASKVAGKPITKYFYPAVREALRKIQMETPPATQPTSRPTTTTTSAPAVDPKVMAILKRLEAAGEKYPNITAKIDYKVDMLQTGDTEERTGRVYYQGPGKKTPAKFRIHFDTLRQGTGPKIKDVVDYAFDGAWLTVRKERIKQMNLYQVAPPGRKVNPLQLGKGPFPVPFGQKADTVIKHFRATTRPSKKTDPKNTDYIKLTTRRRYRKGFSVVRLEMWISRKTSLPVKIVAEDRSENQTTVIFKDTKTPKSFPKKTFTLPRPPSGWEYHVERYKK